jgi:hypothetical protein
VLLAFGDCALLAAGRYDVAYAVKKTRLPDIGRCPDRDYVITGYLRAIDLKEWGDFRPLERYDIEAEYRIVTEVFLRFIPWYRAQYSAREGAILKNLVLNLLWYLKISTAHPREPLYDAVMDLLRDRSAMPLPRFHELQRRFS